MKSIFKKYLEDTSIFKILLKSILHNTGDAMTVYTSVSNVVRLYAKSLANENVTSIQPTQALWAPFPDAASDQFKTPPKRAICLIC